VIKRFRYCLKKELGMFLHGVLIAVLESSNSSFSHKDLTLKVLNSLVQNPILLIEIFINFDCDVESMNIFESMMETFSKIA